MIKIDIKMPSGCYECPCLSAWIESFEIEFNCAINQKKLSSVNKRQEWCPLIEVEE